MGKEVFLGIIDFIITKNKGSDIEIKIIEMGPYDTSSFAAINNKYIDSNQPVMLLKVLDTLFQHFKDVFYARGPLTRLNSHKSWMNYDSCSGEPEGWLPVLEELGKTLPQLKCFDEKSTSQNGLIWLFPLSVGSDGQCYNKANSLHQELQLLKMPMSVLMAPLGCVAMARNKGILNKILDSVSPSLGPQSLLIDFTKYDHVQLQEFLCQSTVEYFILKPTNATLSEGIFLAKKEDLALAIEALKRKDTEQLKALLKKYQTPENFKFAYCTENKLQSIINYWQQDDARFVLVQSYCFAAPILHENKQYYSSKGRAVILAVGNKVYVIDIYFHAPIQALTEDEQFTYIQCVIGGKVNTVYFNPPDNLYLSIKSFLEKELHNVFAKACSFNLQDALLNAIAKNDDKTIRYLLTSCSTLPLGSYREDYIAQLKKNISTSPMGLLFLDFVVMQVAKYYLANEERKEYDELFTLLLPNISLLNAEQLEMLIAHKEFVLRSTSTDEFNNFFVKLEDLLTSAKKSLKFSMSQSINDAKIVGGELATTYIASTKP
jgi:hypothetical protein